MVIINMLLVTNSAQIDEITVQLSPGDLEKENMIPYGRHEKLKKHKIKS